MLESQMMAGGVHNVAEGALMMAGEHCKGHRLQNESWEHEQRIINDG